MGASVSDAPIRPKPPRASRTTTTEPAARHGILWRPPARVVVTSDQGTIGSTTEQYQAAQSSCTEQTSPTGG